MTTENAKAEAKAIDALEGAVLTVKRSLSAQRRVLHELKAAQELLHMGMRTSRDEEQHAK